MPGRHCRPAVRGAACALAAALVVAALSRSAAADLTEEEIRHVRALAEMLDAESARARDAAECGIRAIGPDAILVLAEARTAPGSPRRTTLEDVCRASDRSAARLRLKSAAAACEDAAWAAELLGIADSLGAPPADVDATVREILEKVKEQRSWSSDDPSIRSLVALGHDAVPELLRAAERSEFGAHFPIERALVRLAADSDVPALRSALLDGHSVAVDAALASLAEAGSADAERALIDAVRAGVMSFEIGRALKKAKDRDAAGAAVLGWARANPRAGSWHAWPAAEALAALRPEGAADAVAAMAESQTDAQGLSGVGEELLRLGDLRGADALLRLLNSRPDGTSDGWRVSAAVRTLDRLTGQSHPALTRGTSDRPADPASCAAAADEFAAWLDRNRATLRFDEAARRWTTAAPDAPGAATIRRRAMDLLAEFQDVTFVGDGTPEVERLAELGRDAVPVLLDLAGDGAYSTSQRGICSFALAEIATADDVPALRSSLLAGREEVCHALGRLASRRVRGAVEALVAAVDADLVTGELCRAAERTPAGAPVAAALVVWLNRRRDGGPGMLDDVCRLLRVHRAAGAGEALRRFADAALGTRDAPELGITLVTLGERAGFELILRAIAQCANAGGIETPWGLEAWPAIGAVETMDRVREGRRPRLSHVDAFGDGDALARRKAWFRQAREEIEAWWAASKDRLVWDPEIRRWSVTPADGK